MASFAVSRGAVRDFKHLPPVLQEKYIALGVVMPYIVRRLGSRS